MLHRSDQLRTLPIAVICAADQLWELSNTAPSRLQHQYQQR